MIRWIRSLMQSRIVRDRRSAVAAIVGLTAIPMVLTAGLALDGSRVWLLQTRLQQAVDASVLLAASSGETSLSQTQVQTDTSNLFWADFGRTSRTGNAQTGFTNTGFLNASMSDTALSVTFPDANHVKVAAAATLPTTFMNLTGISTISVSASGTAERAGGVEVALVLDNTGSMKGWPIQAVQSSANELVNILCGHAPGDSQPERPGRGHAAEPLAVHRAVHRRGQHRPAVIRRG